MTLASGPFPNASPDTIWATSNLLIEGVEISIGNIYHTHLYGNEILDYASVDRLGDF